MPTAFLLKAPAVQGTALKIGNEFNPLKPKLISIIFKNSVRTSKKTILHCKGNWLMLFEKIIPVYIENHTKPIKQNAKLLVVKAGGTYSYHWALKINAQMGGCKVLCCVMTQSY
jgi:hypothetical protein